jgi:hypothetical protein
MRRGHYAWASLRRTGRQLGMLGILLGIGFVVLVASLLVFGPGE